VDRVEVDAGGLALDQDDRLAGLAEDDVVNLLSLLGPDVGGELRDDGAGVEDVVAERVDERHHQRGLGRFLGLQEGELLGDAGRDLAEAVNQVHGGLTVSRGETLALSSAPHEVTPLS
jgi:hypothetical protein